MVWNFLDSVHCQCWILRLLRLLAQPLIKLAEKEGGVRLHVMPVLWHLFTVCLFAFVALVVRVGRTLFSNA